MYSCTMPVPDPGPLKHQKAVSVLIIIAYYDIASIFGNDLGLVKVWMVCGMFKWTAGRLC